MGFQKIVGQKGVDLLDEERNYEKWVQQSGEDRLMRDAPIKVSFSGSERNHFFLNTKGSRFDDISGISGLDSPADGRVFVTLDYDRDGWQDIALANSNSPRFNLFRNRFSERLKNSSQQNRFIAVRLRGGNRQASPSSEFSNRDGVGAVVRVETASLSMLRELRLGDGLAAQNSSTMLIGLGADNIAEKVEIRWPSGRGHGRIQVIENIVSGTMLTVFENPSDSPKKSGFQQEPYLVPQSSRNHVLVKNEPLDRVDYLPEISRLPKGNTPKLILYMTTTTHCLACKRSIPHLNRLKTEFDHSKLAIRAIPVDSTETEEDLKHYLEKNKPPYQYVLRDDERRILNLEAVLEKQVGRDRGTPCTFIADSQGNILHAQTGVPSISTIRKLLSSR